MEQNINEKQKTAIAAMNKTLSNQKKFFKGKTEFKLTTIDNSTPERLKKTTNQREADKRDRHFHQRMLRAYLKGKETFNFGFRYDLATRYPIEHKVLFAWE